jgi:hypothetical protein
MAQKLIKFDEMDKKIVLNACMIGILSGLVLCAFFLTFNWLWSGVYDHEHYNYQLDSLKNVQYYVVLFFIPLGSGILSVTTLSPYAKGILTSLISGAITGIILGLFASLIFAIGILAYIPIGAIFLIILVCTVITVASAFIYTVMTSVEINDDFEVKSANKTINVRMVITVIASLFVLLIVIPPAFGFVGVNTGLMHRAPHDGIAIAVTVQRLSDDSILITNHGGPGAYWIKDNGAFIIDVNGKNATNEDAIGQSGLLASIIPAEGLGTSEGSSVTITGSDIVPKLQDNNDNSTHVFAICITKNGYREVVMDTYI